MIHTEGVRGVGLMIQKALRGGADHPGAYGARNWDVGRLVMRRWIEGRDEGGDS